MGLMSCAEALRNSSPRMKDRALPGPKNIAQIPELAERGIMKLGWFMKTLNRQLSYSEFVAGDSYSVADITATVTIDFAEWVKVCLLYTSPSPRDLSTSRMPSSA